MNESCYLLQSLGFSLHSLQNGTSFQIIKDVALKIKQLPNTSNSLIDISTRLLPLIEDVKFVPIWVVLLENLSSLSQQEEVQAIYKQINEKQGSLPKEILHKLWLSHLPCLECAVLNLVEHVCSKHHMCPVAISDSLMKSCLVEIASKEIVIYETVFRMFLSVIVSSHFAQIMIEITAEFCRMVRTKTSQFAFKSWTKNSSTLPGRIHQLETLVSSLPDPKILSSVCILNTFQNMHRVWKDIEKVKAESTVISTSELLPPFDTTSEVTPGQHFEDLYSITIQYRSWVFSALNNILLCDHQYVEPCLWFIAAHHRIRLSSPILKIEFSNFVCGLRDLLSTSNQTSRLASKVTSLAEEAGLAMESRAPTLKVEGEKHQRMVALGRSVISLLLMTFFFQSDEGFTVGNEILAVATSSKDITDHIRCVTYHYHVLNITPKQWSAVKHDQFLLFVCDLCAQLENENSVKEITDFLHLHSELKSLLLGLQ